MKKRSGNRELYPEVAVPALILLAGLIIVLLVLSGVFEREPVVEIRADNCYSDTLHVVTDIDYEPFSFVNSNGEYSGLDVELISEVANRLEMNLDLELCDWNMAGQKLYNGSTDVILNMETDIVSDDDRLIATIPTTEKQYVVYGREKVTSVIELYGKRIASLHELPELGLDREVTYLSSYKEIFEALKKDEYDFAVCPIQVGNEFLEKMKLDDIEPSYAVLHVYGAMALRSDKEELRDRINVVLKELQDEGFIQKLDDKWINHRYQTISLSRIIKYHPALAAVFITAALIIFLLSVIAIERHKHQVVKNTFLTNMSHDLKTPMNAIIGYASIGMKEDDPGRIKDYLEKIESSGRQLLRLINDILEMSRFEKGKMVLKPERTDIVKTAEDVCDMFILQMEEKEIDFNVDFTSVSDRFVICDKSRFSRVMINLLGNAVKFTGEKGRIDISIVQKELSEEKRGLYELKIRDNGIGMSEEFAAKVFASFERERTSTESGMQGTGLGMSITKAIVDLMGGSIELYSKEGEGSEFTVDLTFEICREEEDETTDVGKTLDLSGKRILLVEDNEINMEIAVLQLEEAGFIVEEAINGKEALDMVASSKPGYYDLILMDIQMPVMNGYEATREIRKLSNEGLKNIPIVALSANSLYEDRKEGQEAGMNAHIDKPFEISNVLDTIKKFTD